MSRLLFDLDDATPARQVWSVTELNQRLRDTVQRAFSSIWVSGEISDLARPSSGHVYFSLKDAQGTLKGVMWRGVAERLRFELRDGLQVICEGSLDVYPPRGTYQLIARQIEPQGVGALQLAFLQLHERLTAAGLFAAERKRPLPPLPRRLGVVTSPTGAAIRDFLEVLRRRWPAVDVLVYPTRVQGAEAAVDIVAALEQAYATRPALDCLVITRGGGSLEDLWCFNEERVVRQVAMSPIPIVSAVGHEIDVTLCDLAADVRALTPSEAAERVVPDMREMQTAVERQGRYLESLLTRRLQLARARLEGLANRPVLAHPEQRLSDLARALDDWDARLEAGIDRRQDDWRRRVVQTANHLSSLSPLGVLGRGYSVTQRHPHGPLVRSFDDVKVDDLLATRVAHGTIISRVLQTEPITPDNGESP